MTQREWGKEQINSWKCSRLTGKWGGLWNVTGEGEIQGQAHGEKGAGWGPSWDPTVGAEGYNEKTLCFQRVPGGKQAHLEQSLVGDGEEIEGRSEEVNGLRRLYTVTKLSLSLADMLYTLEC